MADRYPNLPCRCCGASFSARIAPGKEPPDLCPLHEVLRQALEEAASFAAASEAEGRRRKDGED